LPAVSTAIDEQTGSRNFVEVALIQPAMALRAISTSGLLGSPVSRLITVMLSIPFLQV